MAKAKAKSKTRRASTGHFPPNDLTRRQRTRKENRCQLCEAKVPLKDQYVVVNNLEDGSVSAHKDASKPSRETMSHYCADCKDKRLKQKQAWLDARDGESKPRGRPKSSGSGKAKTAARGRPAKKAKAKKGGRGAAKPRGKAAEPAF